MKDLELCPFCGTVPVRGSAFGFYVRCPKVGCPAERGTKHLRSQKEADAVWNRRVPDPAEHTQLLEKALGLSDHIIFNDRGAGAITDQEAFAEYFFAYVAVEAARLG